MIKSLCNIAHITFLCIGEYHAEVHALLNAKKCPNVDLTKCSLYTTELSCEKCVEVILQAKIRVVVYGKDENDKVLKATEDMVYLSKAFFM